MTNYKWVLNHDLLSGDVASKFNKIASLRESNYSWDDEFRALLKVQPSEITIGDIEINVGDTWMGELTNQIYSEFCQFRFNVDASFKYIVKGNIGIWDITTQSSHEEKENTFQETFILDSRTVTSSKYFGIHKDPKKGLFTMMFYGKQPTGKYAPDESKPRFRIESDTLTQKLRMRQKLLAEEFNHFCKENYGYELQQLYNQKVQSIRHRTWDGTGRHLQYLLSYLGMSQEWQDKIKARPYQLDGAWRLIADEHNVLLGHEVGLGKTAISCVALMYRIKMGATKKAMVVVQKSTLLQFAQTFQSMFPLTRLLVMDSEKINKHNRQRFLAEASLNCYEAIIITHEAFEVIDISPDALESYFEDLIEEIEIQVEQSCKYKNGEKAKSQTKFYKDCLAIYENYQKIVAKAKDKIYETGTIFFDELGIDLIIYDEAQKVKNGLFISFSDEFKEHSPSNFSASASNIASDFFFKTEIMKKQLGNQCIWLLTGTPEPTNSPKGVYFMLRVLIPDLLESFGVLSFDAFISHFIMFSDEPEFKPDGSIQEARRMTGVKNYKSLARLLSACYDIKRYDDVKHYFPNGFRPEETFVRVECPLSEFQLAYMDELRVRYEAWIDPKAEKNKYPIRDKEGYLMWQPMTYADLGIDRRDKYDKPSVKYRQYLLNPHTEEKMKSIDDEFYEDACLEVCKLIYEKTKDDEQAGLLPPSERYKYFYTIDSFFQIYGDATKLMLDERLVKSDEWYRYGCDEIMNIDPNGKVMTTARYVADWYHNSAHKRTTCVIFLDLGAPNSAMKLSLYQEIKLALVDLMVKSEEIAFIQDYDTDEKKMTLFDRFNNGEIRILLGHTRSLGIGVNIQQVLELMILFDIPKTPDMHEQRVGRILRSGNTNQKVTIVQVLAKGKPGRSYGADPHAFELLLRKIIMREAVFSFNESVNNIETDVKETETLFELLKAHATGDIRILEYKEKKTKLDTLCYKKSSYERDLKNAESPTANGSVKWLEKQQTYAIKMYDLRCQDLELAKQINFDNFTINLNNQDFKFVKHQDKSQLELTEQTYTQAETEFCKYFQKYLDILLGKTWADYLHKFNGKIGSFNRIFDIYVNLRIKSFHNDRYQYDAEWILLSTLSGKGYTFLVSSTNTLKSIIKNLKGIESLVKSSKEKVNQWGKDIDNKKKKIADYKLWIGQLQSQIDALKPEVDRLGYELGMGEKPPEPESAKTWCPFEYLGISRSSSLEDAKTQYKTLIRQYHPDLNQSSAIAEEQSKLINKAFDEIKLILGA